MSAIESAIENWKLEEVVLLPPNEESLIRERLGVLGRPYSRDVVALYCVTGGMAAGESDSHMLSLWPLERVISETARYSRPYIPFADFCLDAHLYCFQYKNDESSSVAIDYFTGEEPEVIARSVTEFFENFYQGCSKATDV